MPVRQIIISIHHELAIGLSDERLHNLYENELRPFIRLFYAHQEWHFAHYMCGEYVQWLQVHHREALSAMHELSTRKQAEILGGAYYPAIISLLSPQDRTAQMVEMALSLRERFAKKPHGAYLSSDIWEPSLAHSLKAGDLHYTFVDRRHFSASGVSNPGEVYLTEEMGKSLMIFPFYRPNLENDTEQEIEKILQLPCDGDGLLTLMSDARDVNALERLLNGLQAHGLTFTAPSKVLLKNKSGSKPLPRIYLAASSGEVFSSNNQFYRNELFKHFSLQLLHAKNLYTALSVRQVKRDKSRKNIALDSVLRAQNHQIYWHSRFGGFFNAQARAGVMRHLLQADQIVREAEAIDYGVVRVDFDLDGVDEILYQSPISNAFVHARGAVLFTLDWLPSALSLLNVFLPHHVAGYSRAFHDLFFDKNFSYTHWQDEQNDYEQGYFANSVYELVEWKAGSKLARYVIERNFDETLLALSKTYRFYPEAVVTKYTFTNHALGHIHRQFGVEFNFSLDQDSKIYINDKLHQESVIRELREFKVQSPKQNIELSFKTSQEISLWQRPLYGECQGVGVHYQGVALLLLLEMDLAPVQEISFEISLKMRNLEHVVDEK